MSIVWFLFWKLAIFRKVKEIKNLSGGVVLYAAQSNVQIDSKVAEKGGFRTKTKYALTTKGYSRPFAHLSPQKSQRKPGQELNPKYNFV